MLKPCSDVLSASCCDVFIGDDGAKGNGEELSWILLRCNGGDVTSFEFNWASSSEPCLSDDAAIIDLILIHIEAYL